MDANIESQRGKIIVEIRRAIRNINRNLYEWRHDKTHKSNFSISFTEVYGLTRNWIIRCLRSAVDRSAVDRIFKRGHLFIQIDELNCCIANIRIDFHQKTYDAALGELLSQILKDINFELLRYNPKDYEADGLTQKEDEFFYKPFEPIPFDVNEFKLLMPKM